MGWMVVVFVDYEMRFVFLCRCSDLMRVVLDKYGGRGGSVVADVCVTEWGL